MVNVAHAPNSARKTNGARGEPARDIPEPERDIQTETDGQRQTDRDRQTDRQTETDR